MNSLDILFALFSIVILLCSVNFPAIICARVYHKKCTIKTPLAITCIILQTSFCIIFINIAKYPVGMDMFLFVFLIPFLVFGLTYLRRILSAKNYGKMDIVVSTILWVVYLS
jgi:hypothetical protein